MATLNDLYGKNDDFNQPFNQKTLGQAIGNSAKAKAGNNNSSFV